MAEGIEFVLELEAKLDAATQMIKVLSKVELEALKTDAALKKAEKRTSMFGDGMRKVGSSLRSVSEHFLGSFTALAAFEGLKKITAQFFRVGEEALIAAGQAERMRSVFETMVGVPQADELLGFLDRLAMKTEFTDGPLKSFAMQLSRAGFAGDDLKIALAGVTDLAAMSEDKMEGAARALSLMSKIKLQGEISSRDLFAAGFSPESFFKRVAEETGIGMKNIEKAIGTGKVKSQVLLDALLDETEKRTGMALGDKSVAMGPKFLAMFEKAKDIIPNLFEDLEKKGGLKNVTGALEKLVLTLSPDSPAGSKIIGGLSTMLDKFGRLVGTIDWEVWSSRIVKAMELVTAVFEFGASEVERFGNMWDKLTMFGDSLGESLFETVQAVKEFVPWFFNAAVELGTNIVMGLKEGVTAKVSEVVDSVKYLGKELIGGIESVLKVQSPSLVFANIGMMTALGFGLGVERAMPGVAAGVAAAFSPALMMPEAPAFAPMGPLGLAAAAAPAMMMASQSGPQGPMLEAHVTVNIGAGVGGEGGPRAIAEQAQLGVMQGLRAALRTMSASGGGP